MDPIEALEHIQKTYPYVERWAQRATRLDVPEVGSELAVDDRVSPGHPLSQVARFSLLSAGEHLRLAINAIDEGHIYPSAHFTVLRGALVGAAQGVWQLAPEDTAERQLRGLMILKESDIQERKWARNIRKDKSLPDSEIQRIDAHIVILDKRIAEASDIPKLFLTTVVTTAITHLFGKAEHADSVLNQGIGIWQRMGGDAHVLGWSTMQRAISWEPDARGELGNHTVAADPASIVNEYICAYRLLHHGWVLYDHRGEGK